ncbi:MAG: GvpL/GvpF family gas vesicle protein [Pseudomonadota bacterium]
MPKPPSELIAVVPAQDLSLIDTWPAGCSGHSATDGLALVTGPRPKEPNLRGSADQIRRSVAEAALVRQRRLEALMPFPALLPAHPGMPVPKNPTDFTRGNAPVLRDALARLAGRVQVQVVFAMNLQGAAAHFGLPPEAVPGHAQRLGDRIAQRLANTAEDAIALPLAEGQIANLVLQLRRADVDALDEPLHEIDAIWTDGLRIRVLGPGPAVSFTRVRTDDITRKDVLAAAKCLGLDSAHPPQLEEIAAARRAALRDLGRRGTGDPSGVARAAERLRLCHTLGRAPAAFDRTPLAWLDRDGPSLAVSSDPANLPQVA